MKLVLNLLSILALSFLIACGGGEKKEATAQKEESVQAEVVTIELSGDDQMKFNLKTIDVPAGSTVKINFKHTGQMSMDIMGHNFVLLKADVDLTEFAMSAMAAKDTGYIPADKTDQVIASTKIIGGGESTTIEFPAPAPGTYKFFCSFPGHFGTMQGDFIVK